MLAFQRQVPFCDRLPLLTYLGLCIWNPGSPPTSMETLWAEGGGASGIPTRTGVLKQLGGAKSFAPRERCYCLRPRNPALHLVRVARAFLLNFQMNSKFV